MEIEQQQQQNVKIDVHTVLLKEMKEQSKR